MLPSPRSTASPVPRLLRVVVQVLAAGLLPSPKGLSGTGLAWRHSVSSEDWLGAAGQRWQQSGAMVGAALLLRKNRTLGPSLLGSRIAAVVWLTCVLSALNMEAIVQPSPGFFAAHLKRLVFQLKACWMSLIPLTQISLIPLTLMCVQIIA